MCIVRIGRHGRGGQDPQLGFPEHKENEQESQGDQHIPRMLAPMSIRTGDRSPHANSLRGQSSAGFAEICAAFQRDNLRRRFSVRVLHAQPGSAV